MSRKYNVVAEHYRDGLWGKEMVHNAVVKGWITASEYAEIVGEPYDD